MMLEMLRVWGLGEMAKCTSHLTLNINHVGRGRMLRFDCIRTFLRELMCQFSQDGGLFRRTRIHMKLSYLGKWTTGTFLLIVYLVPTPFPNYQKVKSLFLLFLCLHVV